MQTLVQNLISELEVKKLLTQAEKGIIEYLEMEKEKIRPEIYKSAKENTVKKLSAWLTDPYITKLSPKFFEGVKKAIVQKRWKDIIDAYMDDISFGTAGIRGLAAFATPEWQEELQRLANEGIGAPILKGPNTINDIVLLLKSAGVAKYARERGFKSVVIGFDSRIRGREFAAIIARAFLAEGLKVYLFDEACPFPELTFAVPELRADLGILISASHNDKRYNGYKLTESTGAQLTKRDRDLLYNNYIKEATPKDIKLANFAEVPKDQLVFLGGDKPLDGDNVEYYGREKSLINMHKRHSDHIKKFILDLDLMRQYAPAIKVGFSAYHGAGRKAVPQLLQYFSFKPENIKIVDKLNELDGLFPCFMLEQQPDPGDTVAAEIAVKEFKNQYGEKTFQDLDFFIGTDPDADRTGIMVKVPEEQQSHYRKIMQKPPFLIELLKKRSPDYKDRTDFSWHLLDADNSWTILLWYRLMKEAEKNGGVVPEADKKFVVLSHTTTDAIVPLARKYGLGVIKTWVGFALISTAIRDCWDGKKLGEELEEWNKRQWERGTGDPKKDQGKKIFPDQNHPFLHDVIDMVDITGVPRSFNFAAMEQSNGFSILGEKPKAGEIWGRGGHVRDKDGTFAAILLAEVQAYAKSIGKTLIELIDEKIYLDPQIGLYFGYYEPEPYWGQFEGPEGMSRKINLLNKVEDLRRAFEGANAIEFAGMRAKSIESYRTGKYDERHRWKLPEHNLDYYNAFPDEGIRFYFDDAKLNHLTVRPSGTSECLRFHCHLKPDNVTADNLYDKKVEAYETAVAIVKDVREKLGKI
jgi:phosphomannomutase